MAMSPKHLKFRSDNDSIYIESPLLGQVCSCYVQDLETIFRGIFMVQNPETFISITKMMENDFLIHAIQQRHRYC